MKLLDVVREVRRHLEESGRVSLRMLRRQYELDDEALDELIEELVDVQRVARREENVLVWSAAAMPSTVAPGSATPGATDQVETRKVISIIFADLMGSTALQERLDPESVNRVMDAYYQAVRGPVEAAAGTVVQLLGDGVLCAFGIPRIAEDDALRAVRAAVGIQQAFREFLATQQWLSVPIGLRVAVNTGEVVVSDEHPAGIGDPLNVAARLQQEARDGEVVIGPATRRLVADAVTLERAGVFALKGRAETVTAYRVVSLERPTGAKTAAFVGRDEELARLTAVYDDAMTKPTSRLAVLLGSPGLGKSRLIDEFVRRQGESVSVLSAHCDAAGSATFAPVAEALREFLQIEAGASLDTVRAAIERAVAAADSERARIVPSIAALLTGSPASPEETFFAIRRLLTGLAQAKPVVLVIDDMQWAEPLLLDLVEHLVQWGGGVPLLVLVGARPELRDVRSSLVTRGPLVADVVTLAGLDAGAAMRLAANVIGAADLPAAVAAKVLTTSEGNPLFVGELVRMLVDEGALTKEGDRWVTGVALASLEMPPTIHALLAARIERLRPEERSVLERAAVVGRLFSRSAVAALLSHNGSELDARLEALRRSELIEPDSGWFLGEPMLRFHHVLIRDAAYRRLLKGTRAELHARFADWVAARAGEADHDETLGWHLEQAHRILGELGPLDAAGRALGERAAQHLAAAGRRALARDDLPVAADLLGRAVDRLDADDAARAELALDWCEALLSAGDVGRAAAAIAELGRFASTGADDRTDRSDPSDRSDPHTTRLRAWHTCFTAQLTVLTAPQGLQAAAEAVAAAAQELGAQGDAGGEAKAHSVHATALARLGKVGACEAALDQALAAARRAGDRRRANAVLAGAPLAALWGPSPVTRASGRCLDVVRVLRITQGAPAVESVALSCQGVLEALRGRTEAARRMLASSRKMVEDLGIAHRLFEADAFAGRIAAMEGDTPTAERLLRGAYEGLRDLGLGIDAARAGALLARALLAQDRVAEAEALSHESEALAGDDLQAAIAWRGVRAEALAKRGEHAAAVELAKAAVAIAAATDALLDHADARVALATALRAAGRGAEADAEERRAIELWEAKGATLMAGRACRSQPAGPRAGEAPAEPLRDRPVSHAISAAGASPSRSARALGRRRRVRANTATAMQARFDAALAMRDFEAIAALFHEDHEEIDHPTGSTYGRAACTASIQRLFRSRDPYYQVEPLATLGELLLLVRRRSGAAGATSARYDVGAYANEAIQLFEVDASGLCRRAEVFATDHLGDAIACLYQRHAELLPEGPARHRAAAVAQHVAMIGPPAKDANHPDRLAAVVAPDFEGIDHRHLSTWSARGADAYLDHLRALYRVATDLAFSQRDLLALEPTALLTRCMHSGIERIGGGTYERPFLSLFAYDDTGRLVGGEWFDDDREAEALARFEELVGRDPSVSPLGKGRIEEGFPSEPFANAASRTDSELFRCFNGRDWEGVLACVAPVMVFDERRRLVRNTCDRDVWLEQFRFLFDVPKSRFTSHLRATRGERLALNFHRFEGEVAEGGGPLAMEDHFALHEVDADGRIVGLVLFDLEDEEAAHAELDARFAAGDGGDSGWRALRSLHDGVDRRDWEGVAAALAPRCAVDDHRRLGWGTTLNSAALFVRSQQSLVELAPDFRYRFDHVRTSSRAYLTQLAQVGTREGGAFESPFVYVAALDAGNRPERFDLYDVEDPGRALARFAELSRSREMAPSPDPFANTASRGCDRTVALWLKRDWETFHQSFPACFRLSDRRRTVQLDLDRDEAVAFIRMLGDMAATRLVTDLLATRGDRLALLRFRVEAADAEVGPSELQYLTLFETDERGATTAMVRWDDDQLDAAYAELDARFEAGDDATQRWGQSRRSFEARDWEAVAAWTAPDFAYRDHRLLGWGTVGDVATLIRVLQSAVDLAPDARYRDDHVRLSEHGSLSRMTLFGTREGGAFETVALRVTEFDELGKVRRYDTYDLEDLDRARARFAELETPAAPFANAASRSVERNARCWAARDWDGALAILSPSLRFDDRRRLMRLEIGYDDFVAQFRMLFDQPASRWHETLLATRGDRFALTRTGFEAEVAAGGGPLAIDEHLSLTEVDADGRWIGAVTFDLDAEDAARAELDARWQAGEGAAHPRASKWLADYLRFFAARDWNAMTTLFAPELVGENHRLVGWGTLYGPAAIVSTLQAQIELAPDTQERVDHVRTCADAVLFEYAWHGTYSGGAFENLWTVLVEWDADGRARRADVWDSEQLPQALARFAEIAVPVTTTAPFENTASRAWRAVSAALQQREVERFAALHPPAFRYRDHRRLVQLDLDRDGYLAFARPLLEMRSTSAAFELLATRGERLALLRATLEIADDAAGPSAVESLLLIETDERGAMVAYDRYELDDQEAAWAEIEARWQTGEGAAHTHAAAWDRGFDAAAERRDWDAAATFFAPAFVAHDHRLVSWGALHGPAGFLVAVQALVELAPDVRARTQHLRASSRALLSDKAWLGTRDGGAFESPFIGVVELDGRGRAMRMDVYDPHHLERALARFAEIRAGEAPDAPAASAGSNAATAAMERMWASFDAGDLDVTRAALDTDRALFTPDFVWEDRRPIVGLCGDLDLMIASLRERVTSGARLERRTILGTAGDRVAIARVLWAGGPSDGRFEVEFITVTEVDEAGIHRAILIFAPDDEDAAKREAWARWAAIDPVAAPWVELLTELVDAWNARNPSRLRHRAADDLVLEDHRHAGLGRIEGLDAYGDSVIVLWDLAPDQRLEIGSWLAVDRHGFVVTARRVGTLTNGGAFESEYLWLGVGSAGRFTRSEFFEIEDLDTALARFEELRADPLTIPAATEHFENTASRAWRGVIAVWEQRDVQRFATLHPPALRYRDHRHLVQLDLDLDGFLSFTRPLLEMRSIGVSLDLVATHGERLALMRSTLEMADDSVGPSAIDSLILVETDEGGDIVAYDRYNLDDEDTARAETQARWEVREGARFPSVAWIRDHSALVGRRAWDAVAALYSPAIVGHDHRLVGWGILRGRTDFLQSLRSMEALSPDARLRTDHARFCPRGSITSNMWVGTRDGGAFESPFLAVSELDADGRVVRIDFYDPHHFDRAQARFGELRPDPLRIPANAATRAQDRQKALTEAGDWEAVRALHSPRLVFDDRRPGLRTTTDGDAYLAGLRWAVGTAVARPERTHTVLATAGDRLELRHNRFSRTEEETLVFEIETLALAEVDADGLLTAIVLFDLADRAAAQVELFERYVASGADGMPRGAIEYSRGLNGRDLVRARTGLCDDFVLEDRRRTGMGHLEGGDAYIASVAAAYELTRELTVHPLYTAAMAPHGRVVMVRAAGANTEGGDFESVYAALILYRDERIAAFEFFEPEDLDAALARLAACGPIAEAVKTV